MIFARDEAQHFVAEVLVANGIVLLQIAETADRQIDLV
jgi:hypothetical protein